MMTKGKALNIKEIAEYLGVHASTVYKYAQQGRIPAFKIGSDWPFTKKHIDAWIDQQTKSKMQKNKEKPQKYGPTVLTR